VIENKKVIVAACKISKYIILGCSYIFVFKKKIGFSFRKT